MELTNEQIIDLWFHYEEIAMHFNELIIQYRLQLMGGAGAIGALSSYLIGSKVEDAKQHRWLRFLVPFLLLVLLVAAAALDLFYYNNLLLASVEVLLEFEGAHPGLNMSTHIAERIAGRGLPVIYTTYGLIILPLAGFTWWAWRKHRNGLAP